MAKKAANKAPCYKEKKNREVKVSEEEKDEGVVVGDMEVTAINMDIGNGFGILNGEDDDESIMAAARARAAEERARVEEEKAQARIRREEEKRKKMEDDEKAKRDEARRQRWILRRNNSRRQPNNGETGDQTQQLENRDAGEGHYRSDNQRNNGLGWSNGSMPVNSESGSHGGDNSSQVDTNNVNGGNSQRYYDRSRVTNGYRNNGASSHGSQESNGRTNHNRREGMVRKWQPRVKQPDGIPKPNRGEEKPRPQRIAGGNQPVTSQVVGEEGEDWIEVKGKAKQQPSTVYENKTRKGQVGVVAPQEFVSDEKQQVVEPEKLSDSVANEAVETADKPDAAEGNEDPEKPKKKNNKLKKKCDSNSKKGDEEEKNAVHEEDNSMLMTLEEYEKSMLEKKKALKGGEDCRKVTIDKELELMKRLEKKKSDEDTQENPDQEASEKEEEKKPVLKVKSKLQNIGVEKIGLKFQYKPPVEARRMYNNDRGGDDYARPTSRGQGGTGACHRPNGVVVGEYNGNNGEGRPNGGDRGQGADYQRPNGISSGNNSEEGPNVDDRRQHAKAGRGVAGYHRPNAGRGGSGYEKPNGGGPAGRVQGADFPRPNGAGGGNFGNNTEGPGGGDRRQYTNATNARPNGGRHDGNRQQRERISVAPAAGEANNNKRVVEGESAKVASRGPFLRPPRIEDPAQFPALGSSSDRVLWLPLVR